MPELNGLPGEGDFSPGSGLTTLTRTNPNALSAAGDFTQNTPVASRVASTSFMSSPIGMTLCVAGAALIAYKLWTERNGDSHVADMRIGATGLIVAIFYFAVVRNLSAAGAGLYSKYGLPGSDQVSKFFTL